MGLEKINTLKKEKNLTNKKLSELSGIPKSTIDKITSGLNKNPSLETVKSLVHAMGNTLNDLEDSDAEKANPNNIENNTIENDEISELATPNDFMVENGKIIRYGDLPEEGQKELESYFRYLKQKHNL